MRRLYVVLVAVAGLAFASGARAQEPVSYTLDNGLQVVLAPDRDTPKVVMNLRYRVGSMNEPAGRSGFAHLFEHLMFSGTTTWPNVFGAHSALGNVINAWTMEDGTVYYVEGLSSSLPMILSLEADRMANLGSEVDQRELDLQRSVVKNEMRQNVLDQAGGSGFNAVWSALWPATHPYSRTVIGSIADLDAATLDDVRGFFDTYYVPNNAILALVGDFDVEEARRLVAETFGRVPRGAEVPRPSAGAPAATRARIEVTDRVPAPWLMVGFTGPDAASPLNGPLMVAAEIIGNGEYGLLRRRLINEKRIATSVASSWNPGLLGGRFEVDGSAAEGADAARLEAELRGVLQEALAQPFPAAEVERAKRKLLQEARSSREWLKDRAEKIVEAADLLGDPSIALADDPTIVSATPESVHEALKAAVTLDDASVLVVTPGERGGYPSVLLDSSGTPVPFAALARPKVDIPVLETGQAVEARLPQRETMQLSGGVELIHYRMPDASLELVAVLGKGGRMSDPRGKEGRAELASRMAYRGAAERDFVAFAQAAKDIGADIGADVGEYRSMVSMSVPASDFGAGAALLADAVMRPRFDADDWDISLTERLESLEWDLAALSRIAARAAYDQLFAPGMYVTAESLRAVSLEEAREAHMRQFQPSTSTIFSVGSLPMETVASGLEKAFQGWNDGQPPLVVQPYPSTRFRPGRTVVLVPEPGASQAALYVARPAPGIDEPRRAQAVAVMRLLGGDFTSRLNSVIREEKGYSYGVGAGLMSPMETGGGLAVETTVERDVAGPALDEIFRGFAELSTVAVTEPEVARTRTAYQMRRAGLAETARSLFDTVVQNELENVTLEELDAQYARIGTVRLEEVQAQALDMASLDPSVAIVAGDPTVIGPQLEALGVEVIKPMAEVARLLPLLQQRSGDPVGLLSRPDGADDHDHTHSGEGLGRIHGCGPGERGEECQRAAGN